MGLFDSVFVPCPGCGVRSEIQSKSGACVLRSYALEDAPEDVLPGLVEDPTCCPACGVVYEVVLERVERVVLMGHAQVVAKTA